MSLDLQVFFFQSLSLSQNWSCLGVWKKIMPDVQIGKDLSFERFRTIGMAHKNSGEKQANVRHATSHRLLFTPVFGQSWGLLGPPKTP